MSGTSLMVSDRPAPDPAYWPTSFSVCTLKTKAWLEGEALRRARPKEMRVPGASHIPNKGPLELVDGVKRSPLRSRVRRFESYWGHFFLP
jgi:hypothetical protein